MHPSAWSTTAAPDGASGAVVELGISAMSNVEQARDAAAKKIAKAVTGRFVVEKVMNLSSASLGEYQRTVLRKNHS